MLSLLLADYVYLLLSVNFDMQSRIEKIEEISYTMSIINIIKLSNSNWYRISII